MDYYKVYETVNRVIEGHRRGHYDIQEAVNLLEIFSRQQPDPMQQGVFNILWTLLASEPLGPPQTRGSLIPNLHAVAIRAISSFGPTVELPARVFGLLRMDSPELMELWAERICPEFAYSMLHYADRFAQPALDQAKAFCGTYTYARSAALMGATFPDSVVGAVSTLERTIEHIEFSRFAASLKEKQPKSAGQPSQLEGVLTELGLSKDIAIAVQRAENYLETNDPFDAKHAGDLIRTSMEEVHRSVVQELQKMTGRRCNNPEKDGARREYMKATLFITPAEETFFSNIYTLISDEASHKLKAAKETMLLMHRTVKDYLLLLLRRLAERRASRPEDL